MPVCDRIGHFSQRAGRSRSREEARMESVVAALVTGVLTLAGVLVSNSRSRAVMEVKIDNLTRQVERHNCLIERTYALEQDVAVVKAEIDNLRKGQ